ncbi:MAG: Clp protease N-terminal domain-containing protein, partial [bacterium]
MWDKFSKDAKIVIVRAQEEAKRFHSKSLEPEHIVLAIAHSQECHAHEVLKQTAVKPEALVETIEKWVKKGPPTPEVTVQFSTRVRELFEIAYQVMLGMGVEAIGSHHLLLGICMQEGDALRALLAQFSDFAEFRKSVAGIKGEAKPAEAAPAPARVEGPAPSRSVEMGAFGGEGSMWDKFSKDAKNVTVRAQEETKRFRQKFLEPEHILLAVAHTPECTAYKILKRMGVNLKALAKLIQRGQPSGEPTAEYAVQFSTRSREVFEQAYEELRRSEEDTIGSEHLLLGIYKERGDGSRILRSQGVYLGELRAALRGFEDEIEWETGPIEGESVAEKVKPKAPPGPEEAAAIWKKGVHSEAHFLLWRRLTDEAAKALGLAQAEARRLQQDYLEPDHLLLAFAKTPDCAAHQLLVKLGVDPAALAAAIEAGQPNAEVVRDDLPPVSAQTGLVLRKAVKLLRRENKFGYQLDSGHLL